ncbi:LemA protein [Rhodoferax sp. OV413]|uniref:LemA family protein n=1 Tax=Rhodoferax sp. OV413 TaxID=1855285 RepID=UPI00088D9566|nr:LemA family protein [Rhodoferax sp. OV413]SDP94749.1 LemA protein [Rhodoferax sp. OV413]
MISGSIVGWGLAALLLFWSVGAYNRLVRLRGQAVRAFAALAPLLQRYGELLPSGAATDSPSPSAAWSGLYGAHAQFTASLAVARSHPLDAAALAALAAAEQVLQMAWLRVEAEGLGSDGQALAEALPPQWAEIQRHVEHTKPLFAQAVHSYNSAITQFPAVLLAWLFGFRAAQPL